MNTLEWIQLIGIISVLFVGIANIIITLKMSKLGRINTCITIERNRWKEEIRKAISEFCGYTRHWTLGSVSNFKQKEQEILQKIDYLRSYIKLSLNPDGEIEKGLLLLLDQIPQLTDPSKHHMLKVKIDEMEKMSSTLLKREWEIVKKEAYGKSTFVI